MTTISMRSGEFRELLLQSSRPFFSTGMTMVEIGSYAGSSASVFASLVGKLYCVDSWTPYDPLDPASDAVGLLEAEKTFDQVVLAHSNVVKLKMTSLQAAALFPDRSLDAVYIDGDHRYESVLADLKAWLPKIRMSGVIAGHDYGNSPGVRKAVDEVIGRPTYVDYHQNWYKKKGSAVLSAVMVCVDWAPMLRKTLLHNAKLFDQFIVVTAPDDPQTAEVVASVPGVRLVQTTRFSDGGQAFNKGAGINDGFAALDRPEWVVHLDCDIVVNPALREVRFDCLDQTWIYRPKLRVIVPPELEGPYLDFSEWRPYRYVQLADPPTAIGWFQLFHADFFHTVWPRAYPEIARDGATDSLFHRKFPRTGKFEWNCLHLGFTYGGLRFRGRQVEHPVDEQRRLDADNMEDTM